MNIRHYLDAGAMGADVICRRIGIDDDYRAMRRLGVFTAEHHIRYFSEMHLGGKYSTHTVVVERSAKAGHVLSFILDRTDQRLACTVEIVLVGVGMDTRRPAPFPDDIAAKFDELIDATNELTWELPLSGAMGIRRS
ncbi:thioesterase family protein [Nocardioides sambongensis]|uniref:thioesterase family protein n=1 Tax=Nocardioides sambongensis TaxID=2589074 RepID=UPI0038B2B834